MDGDWVETEGVDPAMGREWGRRIPILSLQGSGREVDTRAKGRGGEAGITILETLLALAIGALVVVGSISFYTIGVDNQRIEAASSQIQTITGGVHSLYASQNSYAGLTTSVAITSHVFPPDMVDPSGSFATNPWRGGVTLAPAAGTANFSITYAGVPQSACVHILGSASGYGSGVVSVSGGASAIALGTTSLAPDAVLSSGNCSDPQNNSVVFVVR